MLLRKREGFFMKKSGAMGWSLGGLLLCLIAVFLLCTALRGKPVLKIDTEPVLSTCESALDAAAAGDYAALEPLLAESFALGSSPARDRTAAGRLWDAYLKSLSYEITSDPYAVGTHMAVDVRVTCLDMDAVTGSLKTLVPEILSQKASGLPEDQVYDSAHSYQPDFLRQVLAQSAARALENSDAQTTHELTVQLSRENGSWKIVPTDGFLNLLSGFVSA